MTPEPNNDTLVVTRVANGWTVQPANSPLAAHTYVFTLASDLARHIMDIAGSQNETPAERRDEYNAPYRNQCVSQLK